ncbi:UxaA family hydrolase [Desulfosporosinus lacus]|uniref:Altronate dehydratase small subunit n=1 Tax=Desulfosporosinus lacus DSM 15449 TaxID=1121420 RepID=A0A1M5ZNH4_9FIRM|nr:UxaA family hydrolase [Desulfosporosinus lacus]SHI25669.1 altronate dehydratase small subunit [Desulfosporosinus lacus DSM 15449]
MLTALCIHPRDNVAVVLREVRKGEDVLVNLNTGAVHLTAQNDIPFGHKIAVTTLPVSKPIIKYGEEIGNAKTLIQPGEWVHLENVYCERGRED